MGTTSTTTVGAVQAAFLSAVEAELPAGVEAHRVWPGANATRRMVFFTDVEWVTFEDAVIKAGRRSRNEEYNANFECWVFPEDTTDGAGAISDALAIFNACEEAVVKAGSTVNGDSVDGVVHIECQAVRLEPVAFEKGWAAVVTGRLNVTARLT